MLHTLSCVQWNLTLPGRFWPQAIGNNNNNNNYWNVEVQETSFPGVKIFISLLWYVVCITKKRHLVWANQSFSIHQHRRILLLLPHFCETEPSQKFNYYHKCSYFSSTSPSKINWFVKRGLSPSIRLYNPSTHTKWPK
jgi:hypothetical protein